MNTQNTDEEIEDFELADCENWAIDNASITTSPGYVGNDTDPTNHHGPYWGIFSWTLSSGVSQVIRQRQGKLEYATDELATIWVACAAPATGLTEKPCTFAVLNGTVVWANGTDTCLSSTDGITWVSRAGLPKGFVKNNGANRVIFFKQPAAPFRIDWSNINDPLTIGASSYQLIDPNNGEEIVGFGMTPKGTNVVLKRNTVYEIATYVDNGIIDVNFIGYASCASHQTIATTEDSVIWAGWTQIYELRDGIISVISGKISPIGRNNVFHTERYCGAYYNYKYHLSMADVDVDGHYPAQEYILYKKLSRGDPVQPYPITRNRRYFGCYGTQDGEFSYGRDMVLFAGDSRSDTDVASDGSNTIFAFINDFRDPAFTQGLDGAEQPAFFVTKYFTDNVPFYVKHYRKMYLLLKVQQNLDITIGYRFLPYGAFTEITDSLVAGDMSMIYDDSATGGFTEGFGFSEQREGSIFHPIENTEKPRGIQFKISTSEIEDVQIYEMSYQYRPRIKFK